MKRNTLIYLHGFRSSPESRKATFLRQYCFGSQTGFLCPPLDMSPKRAIEQSLTVIKNMERDKESQIILIGSSLGGFYVTWLMQNLDTSHNYLAIVINPAINPFRDLKSEITSAKQWQLEAQNIKPFTTDHHHELEKLEKQVGTKIKFPDNILLVAAKGDELLSWEDMSEFYKGCQQYIVDGSDHGMSDFEKHWSNIKTFIEV